MISKWDWENIINGGGHIFDETRVMATAVTCVHKVDSHGGIVGDRVCYEVS